MIPIYSNHPNSKWGQLLTLILLIIILGCTQNDSNTGTVDETDTGIVAMLYNPDMTPAVGANVKIFEVTDTTKIPVSEVITGENGNYSLRGLAKGTYNVYAEKDELVAFQDSINVLEDTVIIEDDTLETPTNISGVVGLQPNHDPRTVTVQVLGTDIYSNVNEDGYFTLNRMAKGDFTLKLSTTLQNYTTTYENLTIDADTPDTLADTLWLIYTGIPVVEGLTAIYDTLNGVVTLSWNATKYRNFQDYLIYRDYFDSLNLSSTPIAFTDDTVFYDSILDKSKTSGAFSFSDTNGYHFKYRVTVRNNSQEEGLSYKYIGVIAASPEKVRTYIEAHFFHVSKGFITDSCSINDSVLLIVKCNNSNRTLRKLSVNQLLIDSTISMNTPDSTHSISDSVNILWNKEGNDAFEIAVTDDAETVWKDTLHFYVVSDKPNVTITTSKIAFNSATRIASDISDKFGSVEKIEWKIGALGTFAEGSVLKPETTVVITDTLIPYLDVFLRVTDDDNNVTIDSVSLPLNIEWIRVSNPGEMENPRELVLQNDKLTIIDNEGAIFSTSNGDTWESLGISPTACDNLVQFKDSIYIVGHMDRNDDYFTLWKSANWIDWESTLIADLKVPMTECKGIYRCNMLHATNENLYASFGGVDFAHPCDSDFPKNTPILWKSQDAHQWDSVKVDGTDKESDSENPFRRVNGKIVVRKFNSMWYLCKFSYDVHDPEQLNIYTTSDWENFELVTSVVGGLSEYIKPTYNMHIFMNSLCVFVGLAEGISHSKAMLYMDNKSKAFNRISNLPVSYISDIEVFNNKIYIVGDNKLWISK